MMIRRSLLRIALVGLFCGGQLSQAQTTPPTLVQASAATEALKGKIWTTTARQIWADMKPKQTQPQPWATDEAFKTWRDKNHSDKSGMGLLWGDVAKRVNATQPANLKGQPATPAQVAQAILAEVEQKQRQDKAWGRLNVAAVRAELQKIVPSAVASATSPAVSQPTPSAVTPAPTSAPAAETTPPVVATPRSASNQDLLPDSALETLPLLPAPTGASPSFIYQHPEQAMLGAGIVGLIIGAVLMAMLGGRKSRSGHRSRRSETDAASTNYAGQAAYLSEQERYLSSQNAALRKQVVELERTISALKDAATPVAPAMFEDSLATMPLPSPDELAEPTPVEAVDVVPVPLLAEVPTPRYGPVQETPFIEERKIVDAPLPQLALMLTPDPHNPDRASFTLNPQVNQTMLIGDGLARLQKFFDYDPPIGRITTVMATEAGQLQRQGDGWQVVERARLVIR